VTERRVHKLRSKCVGADDPEEPFQDDLEVARDAISSHCSTTSPMVIKLLYRYSLDGEYASDAFPRLGQRTGAVCSAGSDRRSCTLCSPFWEINLRSSTVAVYSGTAIPGETRFQDTFASGRSSEDDRRVDGSSVSLYGRTCPCWALVLFSFILWFFLDMRGDAFYLL
jgi:hypothetical protein